MIRFFIISFLWFFSQTRFWSQETEAHSWWKDNNKIRANLFYKNTNALNNLDIILLDNSIQQRLQWDSYWDDSFSSTVSVRNRIFWGNIVNIQPDYAENLDNNDQPIDLDWILLDKPAMVIHTQIDRLYFTYSDEKWEVNLGRQRINWGKNLAFNPNDWFNAYSFFDFDYIERAGVDAFRLQYNLTGDSSLETAINYAKDWKEANVALKYNSNLFNYDAQILVGKYRQDIAVGLGWEGTIKNVGFKGELSYFKPYEDYENAQEVFVGALSLDYFFKNGWFVFAGNLYTSNGIKKEDALIPLLSDFNLSAKTLMPNKNSYFLQVGKPVTPALTASMASLYAQELESFYFIPQLSYNIAQNWDIDFIGQVLYTYKENDFTDKLVAFNIKLGWSF